MHCDSQILDRQYGVGLATSTRVLDGVALEVNVALRLARAVGEV